jgi:hypothetical protein
MSSFQLLMLIGLSNGDGVGKGNGKGREGINHLRNGNRELTLTEHSSYKINFSNANSVIYID